MVTKTSGGNAAFHNFHNDYAHIQDPNERRRLALAEVDKVSEQHLSGVDELLAFDDNPP